MPGKRIQIDDETWQALDMLARDRMMDFQELADEALADLLAKHHRPVGLAAALKQSAKADQTLDTRPAAPRRQGSTRRSKGRVRKP